MKRLRRESGMAIIWITHDLGVMAGLADRVMVMYGGLVVERASVARLYRDPRHPYTRGLLGTLPRLDGTRDERLESIPGQPPSLERAPAACPFAPRCSHAFERCWRENPALETVGNGHEVACWLEPAAARPHAAPEPRSVANHDARILHGANGASGVG